MELVINVPFINDAEYTIIGILKPISESSMHVCIDLHTANAYHSLIVLAYLVWITSVAQIHLAQSLSQSVHLFVYWNTVCTR